MSRPVHPSLDAAFLDDLADSLGRAIADNGGAVLIHVVARPDGPGVGVLPLDGIAPADVLLGAEAPAHWAALGVATGVDRRHAVVLVARDGRVVGRAREGDQVLPGPPPAGVVLDCLQRALGLPTAPPPAEPAADWTGLRELAIEGGWPALGLTPEEASWLDVGAFSRWVMGQRQPWPEPVSPERT